MLRRSPRLHARALLLLSLCLTLSASAQVNNASVTGLVTDTTGAVVPNASVTLKNKATNVETATTTDGSGYYNFPSVPVGEYSLTVEGKGFKRVVIEQVKLDVAQKARVDAALEVGAVTETVTVTSATLLTTQEATTGGVIDNRLVQQLPLSGRNWDDLISLVPGTQVDRYTEETGSTANGRTGGANVHGVRSLQNNFVLDGVDNNSISENVQELTTQVARPSVDSIQEFKVSTNPYSAENGRSPGALVSVVTKSGSNAFHGTLYEFHRNRVFDANNFFNNRAGARKPQNIQNQFGGNLGGPVVKEQAFFFFNYEGTRIRKGVTRLGNVPLANEIRGDFSPAAAAANRTTYATLFDRVGDCRALVPSAFNPNGSFVNNQIPAQCLDPLAQKILALLPAPNAVPGTGPLNLNNFIRNPGIADDTDSYTGRFDWQKSSKDSLFVRYTLADRFRYVPGIFGGIVDGTGSSANGRLNMKGQSAAVGWTHIFSSRLLNEFRIGWGRNNSLAVQDPFGLNTLAEFGVHGVSDSPLYSGGLPGISISARGGTQLPGGQSGFDRLGSPDFLPKSQRTNQFQWTDNVSLSHGPHQLKFGGDVRGPMRNIYLDVPSLRGTLTFDGNRTGVGLADFLLGYPSGAQLSNPQVVDSRLKMFSGYVQDDWKASRRLTLNLGLRYDYATWPYEASDRLTNLDPETGKLFTPANSPFGRSLIRPDKNNFAPRVGLAYQLNDLTVVRSGYGRFYMLFERAGSEDQLALNLPWLVQNNVTAASTSTTANNIRLRNGFNLSLDPATVNPQLVRLRAVNPEAVMPSIDQWNLGLQRLLPGDLVVTADYVGTKGTHLSVLRNLNQQLFNAAGVGTGVIPFPSLGPIEYRDNGGNSNYHGGELTVEKRFSRGFAFRTAYTYSKSIDYAQEHLATGGTGSFTQNARDLSERRGPSDFDIRHRFVGSYILEPPFGKGRAYLHDGALAYILGGWRLSGVTNMRSGRAFTVSANGNSTALGGARGGGLVGAFADCLRDGSLPDGQRTIDRWFDTGAFAVPTPARLGTCGRNTQRGPNLVNLDASLARTFPFFSEDRNLEFRWEVFNVLNTPQFGLPERNLSSSSAGRISTLAGDARVMQFALKLNF